MEFYCLIFLIIFWKLGFLCLWSSTVFEVLLNQKQKYYFFILKIGVLLSLEFFCFWSSSVFGVLRSPYHNRNDRVNQPPNISWRLLCYRLSLKKIYSIVILFCLDLNQKEKKRKSAEEAMIKTQNKMLMCINFFNRNRICICLFYKFLSFLVIQE